MNESEKQIKDTLKFLIENYGFDILKDVMRVNAFIHDLAPHYDDERKLVCKALGEGIADDMLEVISEPDGIKENILKCCVLKLVSAAETEEKSAVSAINTLADALDFGLQIVDEQPPSNPEKRILIKGEIPDNEACDEGLPEGCTAVGYKAFACNTVIERIEIPSSVECIYPRAFYACSKLKCIVLPSEISEIGERAFEKCSRLERIIIGGGGRYTVVNGMLTDRSSRRILRAENRAEYHEIRVPDGIRSISACAFDSSQICSIKLSGDVKEISQNAFYDCEALERIDVLSGNMQFSSQEGVLYSKDRRLLVKYPQGRRNIGYYLDDRTVDIAEGAFKNAGFLESITFSGSLVRIGKEAFKGCKKLSSAVIPANVKKICDGVFQDCEELENVMLPRSITEISDMTFSGCIRLSYVSIPNTVEKIGNGAFMMCRSLKSLNIQENVSYIGNNAFSGCSPDMEIIIRNNQYAADYCKAFGLKYKIV